METFLGNVARYLYDKYGDDISNVRILLPNNRSRLFLLDELGKLIAKPVWQPEYGTIDEMMHQVSGLAAVDRVRAVVELFSIYSKYHNETLDSFYFWGEMLLSDFDQVDKYMVDADMLFANLTDLKEIDSGLSYFNEDQKSVIRRFWASFGQEENYSDEQRSFINVWRSLSPVYHEFRRRLSDMGMAYTGMMHREAAERIKSGNGGVQNTGPVAVVGFNALSECEKVLFDHLQTTCGADFFWDYDDYYLKDKHQEAGLFVRENMARYGQPTDFVNSTSNFSKHKDITAVSVPSGALQCKYAGDFVQSVVRRQGFVGKETAIVLTDESLLVPLLYALPDSVGEVNVTMGYPLRQTLVYSFVERLLRLQTHTRVKGGETAYYHADVSGILTHPFVMELDAGSAAAVQADIVAKSRVYVRESTFSDSGVLSMIFRKQEDWRTTSDWVVAVLSAMVTSGVAESAVALAADPTVATLAADSEGVTGFPIADSNMTNLRQPDGNRSQGHDQRPLDDVKFRREYAGVIAETVRKLSNSLSQCGVEMEVSLFASLCRRMLQNIRIPYDGEPLRGVQVMGILETRNLDFENVMIMSMNDDNFPGNPAASSSFIPYNLRLGYGLPTPQHHDGVYAYYFYRLLQRAGNVDMVYSSKTDEASSGEQSRYIYQLEYESQHDIARLDVGLDVGISISEPITVVKDSSVMARLEEFLDSGSRTVSPTALNAYLDCPLKFYFRYVAGLKPEDEVSEEIDMPMFGTILHKAMELLYAPLVCVNNPAMEISRMIGSESVAAAVDGAIGSIIYNGEIVGEQDYEGNLLMIRDIVMRYINNNLLPFDASLTGFTIAALEQRITSRFAFASGGSQRSVVFSGLADRVDRLSGGVIRIVDYKTGSPHIDFAGMGALFSDDITMRNAAVLQTMLYSMMVRRMQDAGEIEGTEVCPALYYVRMMNADGYSPLLNIKDSGSIMGYAPYREEFEELLSGLLSELFDPACSFGQCPDTKPCEYCDFSTICRR